MTKLALVNPPLAYQGSGDGFEGYRRGFDWGKNHQLSADQSVVDGLDKQIEALQQEVERLKGVVLNTIDYNHFLNCIWYPKRCSNCSDILAKLKAQSEYKEEASK